MLQKTAPTLKTPLSTVVDAFTSQTQQLDLSSKLGKRRLFRHRIWAKTVGDGWLSIKFAPGWLTNLPSGRVCIKRHDNIREGTLNDYIEQVQEQYGVHLWLAPIKMPHSAERGNWYWPGVASSTYTLANVLPQWCGELKAVAA